MPLIAVIGARYTGRSEIADRIETALRNRSLSVCRTANLTGTGQTLGFPMSTKTTAASAEWAMTAGAATVQIGLLEADVVVSEFAPLEALAFWLAAVRQRREHPDSDDEQRLSILATALSSSYALTVATGFSADGAPGINHRDERLRADVDGHLRDLFDKTGFRHHLADTVSGRNTAAKAAEVAVRTRLRDRR